MTERDYTTAVVQLFRLYGWLVYHPTPAPFPTGKRYATHFQGHRGFPDIVAVHPRQQRLIVAELKSRRGRYGEGQKRWLQAFRKTGKVEVYVWRMGKVSLKDIARILAQGGESDGRDSNPV